MTSPSEVFLVGLAGGGLVGFGLGVLAAWGWIRSRESRAMYRQVVEMTATVTRLFEQATKRREPRRGDEEKLP